MGPNREREVSTDQHRTDQVYAVIQSLVEEGTESFRPGHIADALRRAGQPMLAWEIRGELSRLQAEGLITADRETGTYRLTSKVRKAG